MNSNYSPTLNNKKDSKANFTKYNNKTILNKSQSLNKLTNSKNNKFTNDFYKTDNDNNKRHSVSKIASIKVNNEDNCINEIVNTNIEFSSNSKSNNNNNENIKVCLRIRPLNSNEVNRNKKECLEVLNQFEVNFNSNKSVNKRFRLDYVFHKESTQEDVFNTCSISSLIDDVLDGYSVTVFAYGQTGSGKTFTIMGKDNVITNKNNIISSEFAGLIPNTITELWNKISVEINKNSRKKIYVKASFCEIYNESINDLLYTPSKNLHVRFSSNQGFFAEGLLIADCITADDVIEVIVEGNKNRKVGSHHLNPDSSRSHSLLTIYIKTEDLENSITKYGKITFVDLAGSERLKESGSSGGMIKETGNINKSLLILGKVISCLADKKNDKKHIPYRDSKLTMLLMDSIGGSSKTLMISCVSPSMEWAEETLSTLNYSSKSMNIQNRPTIKANDIDKSLDQLLKEKEFLVSENNYIKSEFIKLYGTYPIFVDNKVQTVNGQKYTNSTINKEKENIPDWGTVYEGIFPELEEEKKNLIEENKKITKLKEIEDKKTIHLMEENHRLSNKLNNLETVLIGPDKLNEIKKAQLSKDSELNINKLTQENYNLKDKLAKLEYNKVELKSKISELENPGKEMLQNDEELLKLNDMNKKLIKKIDFLQKRERELLNTLMNLKNELNKR